MLIQLGYQLRFVIPAPTAMLLLLHAYPNRYHFRKLEAFQVHPYTPYELFYDGFGNRCTRLLANPGPLALSCDAIVEVDGQADFVNPGAIQHPLLELPYDVLPFLMPSRYCEVDRLSDFAWNQFGQGPTGYLRAQAVCSFVHHHILFGYQFARNTKTAFDVFNESPGGLPRFCASGDHALSMSGHPGTLCDGISG